MNNLIEETNERLDKAFTFCISTALECGGATGETFSAAKYNPYAFFLHPYICKPDSSRSSICFDPLIYFEADAVKKIYPEIDLLGSDWYSPIRHQGKLYIWGHYVRKCALERTKQPQIVLECLNRQTIIHNLIEKLTVKLATKFNLSTCVTDNKVILILKEAILGYGLKVIPEGEGVIIKSLVPANKTISQLNEFYLPIEKITTQNINTIVKRVGNNIFNGEYIRLFQIDRLKSVFR